MNTEELQARASLSLAPAETSNEIDLNLDQKTLANLAFRGGGLNSFIRFDLLYNPNETEPSAEVSRILSNIVKYQLDTGVRNEGVAEWVETRYRYLNVAHSILSEKVRVPLLTSYVYNAEGKMGERALLFAINHGTDGLGISWVAEVVCRKLLQNIDLYILPEVEPYLISQVGLFTFIPEQTQYYTHNCWNILQCVLNVFQEVIPSEQIITAVTQITDWLKDHPSVDCRVNGEGDHPGNPATTKGHRESLEAFLKSARRRRTIALLQCPAREV